MRPQVIDDLNRNLTESAYIGGLKLISQYLDKNFKYYSLYQFGHCKFPGISDLDMLVVLDSSISVENFRRELDSLKEGILFAKYLFWHSPIIISKDEVQALRLFHTSENPKYISGAEISIDGEVGSPQILIWNSYFYKAFFSFMSQAQVSLRYAHLLLNCLGYSIKNNDLMYSTDYSTSFSIDISKVRESELSQTRTKDASELFECFARGLKIIQMQENKTCSFIWPWKRFKVDGPEYSYQMGNTFRYIQGGHRSKFIYPWRYFDLYRGFVDPKYNCTDLENQKYLNKLRKYLTVSQRNYKDQLTAFVAAGIFDNDICKT